MRLSWIKKKCQRHFFPGAPGRPLVVFGLEIGCKVDYPELRQAAGEAYAILSGAAQSVVGDGKPAGVDTMVLAAWSVVQELARAVNPAIRGWTGCHT